MTDFWIQWLMVLTVLCLGFLMVRKTFYKTLDQDLDWICKITNISEEELDEYIEWIGGTKQQALDEILIKIREEVYRAK